MGRHVKCQECLSTPLEGKPEISVITFVITEEDTLTKAKVNTHNFYLCFSWLMVFSKITMNCTIAGMEQLLEMGDTT